MTLNFRLNKCRCVSHLLFTICGHFVCFWVSRQTVVLYSFFWWLRLTNFWSRTRTHTFGQLRKKASQPWGKEGKDTWSSENFTSDFVAWISLKHLISQKNELSIARTKVNSTGLPALHMTGLEMGKYWGAELDKADSILNQYFTREGRGGGQEMEVRNLPEKTLGVKAENFQVLLIVRKTLLCSSPQSFPSLPSLYNHFHHTVVILKYLWSLHHHHPWC